MINSFNGFFYRYSLLVLVFFTKIFKVNFVKVMEHLFSFSTPNSVKLKPAFSLEPWKAEPETRYPLAMLAIFFWKVRIWSQFSPKQFSTVLCLGCRY